MDFLKQLGYTDQDIIDIKNYNYDYIVENIIINKENVESIIEYLLSIGIERSTIKEIFMYQVGLFFKTFDEIKTSFDEYEIDSIVKSLNYDVNNIELIDFVYGIDSLPERLQHVAKLRLEFPEENLNYLSDISNERGFKLTKSGINHRMRKLAEMAEEIRDNQKKRLLEENQD